MYGWKRNVCRITETTADSALGTTLIEVFWGFPSYSLPCISLTLVELEPVRAILSSTFNSDFEAEKCIDGDTDGPDAVPGVDGFIGVAKCQILLHRPNLSNKILPQEKRENCDKFNTPLE